MHVSSLQEYVGHVELIHEGQKGTRAGTGCYYLVRGSVVRFDGDVCDDSHNGPPMVPDFYDHGSVAMPKTPSKRHSSDSLAAELPELAAGASNTDASPQKRHSASLERQNNRNKPVLRSGRVAGVPAHMNATLNSVSSEQQSDRRYKPQAHRSWGSRLASVLSFGRHKPQLSESVSLHEQLQQGNQVLKRGSVNGSINGSIDENTKATNDQTGVEGEGRRPSSIDFTNGSVRAGSVTEGTASTLAV